MPKNSEDIKLAVLNLYRYYPAYFSETRSCDFSNEKEKQFQTTFFNGIEKIATASVITKFGRREGYHEATPAWLRYNLSEQQISEQISKFVNYIISEYQKAVQSSSYDKTMTQLHEFFYNYPLLAQIMEDNLSNLEALAKAYNEKLQVTNQILFDTYCQMQEKDMVISLGSIGVDPTALTKHKESLALVDKAMASDKYTQQLAAVTKHFMLRCSLAEEIQKHAIEYFKSYAITSTANLEAALKLISADAIVKECENVSLIDDDFLNKTTDIIKNRMRVQILYKLDDLNALKDPVTSVTQVGKFKSSSDPVELMIKKYFRKLPDQENVRFFIKNHEAVRSLLLDFADGRPKEWNVEFNKCIEKIMKACLANNLKYVSKAISEYLKTEEAENFFYNDEKRLEIAQRARVLVDAEQFDMRSNINNN